MAGLADVLEQLARGGAMPSNYGVGRGAPEAEGNMNMRGHSPMPGDAGTWAGGSMRFGSDAPTGGASRSFYSPSPGAAAPIGGGGTATEEAPAAQSSPAPTAPTEPTAPTNWQDSLPKSLSDILNPDLTQYLYNQKLNTINDTQLAPGVTPDMMAQRTQDAYGDRNLFPNYQQTATNTRQY